MKIAKNYKIEWSPSGLTKKISIPKVTQEGVQHNQLSAANYLQNLSQILVNGEPAKKIPPGQIVTKQKQSELCIRG